MIATLQKWFFGALFILCFAVYFTLSSVQSFATDTDSVLAAAKRAELHQTIVDVLVESLDQEVADNPDPAFRMFVGSASRSIIAGTMTADWFYDLLDIAYGGAVKVFEGAHSNDMVDLSERKQKLADALDELGDRGLARCRVVAGSRCQRDGAGVLREYHAGVADLLQAIPERTSLFELIDSRAGRTLPENMQKDEVRRALSMLGNVRWGFFAALCVIGIYIMWLVWGRASDVAITMGVLLILAAGGYLLASTVATNEIDGWVRVAFDERLREYGQSDSVVQIAGAGAERLAREAVRSALGTKGLTVTFSLLGGFALLGIGVAARRHR